MSLRSGIFIAIWPLCAGMMDYRDFGRSDSPIKLPTFVDPGIRPPSYIFSLDQNWPPYNLDVDTLEPFPGCSAQYAQLCAVQHSIRIVTRARQEVCADLADPSKRQEALKNVNEGKFKADGTTGFGVFVMLENGTIIADAVKPALIGSRFDGVSASALVAQPTLLGHIDWVVSWGGGFVPHYSTRVPPVTHLTEADVLVPIGHKPVPAVAYFEACPTGERLGSAFGNEPLPAVEKCNPNSNDFCAVQNINRLVGMTLTNYLTASNFKQIEDANYHISYTTKYSVGPPGTQWTNSKGGGPFYTLEYELSYWGYPATHDPNATEPYEFCPGVYRNPGILPDNYGSCWAIGVSLHDAINGRNVTFLPGTSPCPQLKRGDWLLAVMNTAAWKGGLWQDYDWTTPALGDHYKISLIIGVVWNGSATFLASGTPHVPEKPMKAAMCQDCSADESMACAALNCQRLTAHAMAEALTPAFEWPTLTYSQFYGATHDTSIVVERTSESGVTTVLANEFPPGFSVFAFNFNGTCVADGSDPSNVGKTWGEILQGEGAGEGEGDGQGIHERMIAAVDRKSPSWVSFTGKGGIKRIAALVKMPVKGDFYYIGSAFSAKQAELQPRCSSEYAEPCSEHNAMALVGAANAHIISAADDDAFASALLDIAQHTGEFDDPSNIDFQVQVYTSEWEKLPFEDYSSLINMTQILQAKLCPMSWSAEEKSILSSATQGGGWVELDKGDSTPGWHAFVLESEFAPAGKAALNLRLVALVKNSPKVEDYGIKGPAPAHCTDSSDCPANAECNVDGVLATRLTEFAAKSTHFRCFCNVGFKAEYTMNTSVCTDLKPVSMECVDVRGLDAQQKPHQPCPAGMYCPEGEPSPCLLGAFCPQGSEWPTSCPMGTASDQSRAKSNESCFRCAEGKYANTPGQTICDDCKKGTYSNEVGSISCSPCQMGTASDQTGAQSNKSCISCAEGKYASISGQTICDDCKKGTYSNEVGSISCSPCRIGQYQTEAKSSLCRNCNENATKNIDQWTTVRKMQSASGGSEVVSTDGADDTSFCACKAGAYKESNGECEICPKGMSCGLGSSAANFKIKGEAAPVLLPINWASEDQPTFVYSCVDENHCPGGVPGRDEICGPGLQERSCAKCSEGSYWTGEECYECTAFETSRVLFPTLPFLLGPVIIAYMYKSAGGDLEKWPGFFNIMAALGFVMLNYYQLTDLVGSCNLVRPQESKWSFDSVAFTNNILTFFKPDCAGFTGFQQNMILKCCGPFIVLAVAVFCKSISKLLSKATGNETLNMELNRLFNVVMSLMFTFFSAISSVSLLLFKCRDNPNDEMTLTSDLTITCYSSSEWQSMLAVAVVAVILYCLGFGAVFLRAIYWATVGDTFSDPGFQMRWKFLFIKFRPDVWWWALVFLAKNFLANVGFALLSKGVQQLNWIITVMALYTFMVIAFMPYREPVVNAAEVFAGIMLVYIAALMTWFAPHEDGAFDAKIGSVITFFIYAPFVPAVCIIAYITWKEKLKNANEEMQKTLNQSLAAMTYLVDLTKEDPAVVADFYQRLCAWDRLHMYYFQKAFETEMLGRGTAHARTVDKTKVQKERVAKVSERRVTVNMSEKLSEKSTGNQPSGTFDEDKVVVHMSSPSPPEVKNLEQEV